MKPSCAIPKPGGPDPLPYPDGWRWPTGLRKPRPIEWPEWMWKKWRGVGNGKDNTIR